MTKKNILFLGVIVLTFFCFVPALRNGLLDWDDKGYVLNNVHIRTLSLETITWAFTDYYCNYWAPLTWLSLALDYAVWGHDPFGYHLTNNLIHAVNAGLFFLLSYQLLRRYAEKHAGSPVLDPDSILYSSALAALFFGVHPLRVESVAWVTERKDVLSALFGLGAVLAYLRYTKEEDAKQSDHRTAVFFRSFPYWGMLLLYVLSLLSKAMMITLPLMLLVLDWFPLQRLNRSTLRRLLQEKLPLVLLAALSSIITIQALEATHKTLAEINLATRVLTAFKSIMNYMQFMILPVNIGPIYLHPGNVVFDLRYGISILVVSAVTAYCLLTVKRRPAFLAAWLTFLIALLPVLGLNQNGPQEMAPRFTYIPGLSLSLLAALGIVAVQERGAVLERARTFVWIGVLLMLVCFTLLTARDIGTWKNDVSLWSRVIELQPHMFGKAYYQRSLFLNLDGEYTKALSDVNEALTIASQKNYGGIHEIYAQRARIFGNMKDYGAAVVDLDKAIALSGEPYREMYSAERDAFNRVAGALDKIRLDKQATGLAAKKP